MITICAHCKRIISETPSQDNKISHGICGQCLAKLERDIQESPRTSSNPLSRTEKLQEKP
ncbi:MAG: hypothetical protein AB1640_20395 [bacterium]